jgi:putative DNA primase/helicase
MEGFIMDREEVLRLILEKKRRELSESIVNEILQNKVIYTTRDDQKSEIWIYEEGIMIPQGKTYIKEYTRNILGEQYTTTIVNEVISKIETDTYIDQEEFFKEGDINELPVKNGILNLSERKLYPFTSEKRFFTKLAVSFDPEAKCPKLNNFFKEVLKHESDVKVLMEFFGFCLIKDYFVEKAFMFIGDGRNGKGKTLTILKNLIGLDNISSIPLSQLTEDNFSVSELHSKLVNMAGDISSTGLKDTGLFKSLTGRDPITAHRKFMKDLKFINYAKMVFACNELPRVYDNSKGFWSRWVLLEFPFEFITEEEMNLLSDEEKQNKKIRDPDIINKILNDEELSGLLNQSLDALSNLRKKKDFSLTKGTSEIKDFWIRKSNSFMAFCMDNLKENPECSVSKRNLRFMFSKYCKMHHIKGAGDKDIKATLQDLFGVIEQFNTNPITSKQEWYWVGVEIKDSLKDKSNKSEDTNKSEILDKIKDLEAKDESFLVNQENLDLFNLTEKELKDILYELSGEGLIYEAKPNLWRYLG